MKSLIITGFQGGGAPENNAPIGFLGFTFAQDAVKTDVLENSHQHAFELARDFVYADNFAGKFVQAFTMAEVLITLGIIGIVTAMTLPSIIGNSRNKALEASLKRNYAVISQVLDLYQAQNGERIKRGDSQIGNIKPILMQYLKTVKDCGMGSLDPDACIPNYGLDNEDNSQVYKTYNGKRTIRLVPFDDGQFVLNDGSLVLLENPKGGYLYISVDVNGYNKNPNRLGQDLFMFEIDSKGRLLPMGVSGTSYYSETEEYCSPSSTGDLNGAGCTYRALTDKNYFKNLPK